MEVTISGVEYESKFTGKDWYECESCVFSLSNNTNKTICEKVYTGNNKCTVHDHSVDKFKTVYWVKKEVKKNPHPHAALMLEYAKDMAEDSSIVWQCKYQDGAWTDVRKPLWNNESQYRRKPKEPTLKTEYFCLYKVGNAKCISVDEKLIKNVEAVFNEDTGELVSIKMI